MRSWTSRSRSEMQSLETRTRPLQGAQLTQLLSQLLLGGILCLTIVQPRVAA
uniref:GG10413 n=1 Tax=Drosophila erecta TaxID=7220 RepID=B3P2M4_DROER